MSREIKYRVWDNENKSYNDPYSYAYYAMKQDGRLDFYCHGDHMDEADPDVYFIEQYTGSTDKNGQEIYEGDIVNISDAPAVSGKALVVKFEEFLIGEYSCNKMTGWMVRVINGEWCSSLADVISHCEVIGNVHENKELLGGEE